MKISVKILQGEEFKVEVEPSETILDIKKRLAVFTRIPADEQELISGGKKHINDLDLSSINIREGSTLHLVHRPRRAEPEMPGKGGPPREAMLSSKDEPGETLRRGWLDDRYYGNTMRTIGSHAFYPHLEASGIMGERFRQGQVNDDESYDDDMDIIDPDAFYRRLEFLSDTVAIRSEFTRCGGRYARDDDVTWAMEPSRSTPGVSVPHCDDIPSWIWPRTGSIAPGNWLEQPVRDSLASLWKTCLIFSRVVSNFRELERQQFCTGSFNLLLGHAGTNVAEVVRISVADIESCQQGAVSSLGAILQGENPILNLERNLWNVWLPCDALLKKLNHQADTSAPSIAAVLVTSRVTALLLDLALLSYTGSHGCRIHQDNRIGDVKVFGVDWEDSLVNFQCSLARLACLDEFLDKKEVWVFDLQSGSSATATRRSSDQPLAILTNIRDFADIWGPVYAVPEPKKLGKIRQYNVSKGIICRVEGSSSFWFRGAIRCHWYNYWSWKKGLSRKLQQLWKDDSLSPDDLLLIGDIVVENELCQLKLDDYEVEHGRLMQDLDVMSSRWRWHNQVTTAAPTEFDGFDIRYGNHMGNRGRMYSRPGRYTLPTTATPTGLGKVIIFGTQKRIPETPLKEKILDRWHAAPERRNPQVLSQYLGVEVSHCTGNARRIPVRSLLTLKPVALLLERQFPGWEFESWGPSFKAAIASRDDDAIESVWVGYRHERAHMARLVCYALDLLGPTGIVDGQLRVGFFNHGQELSLDLNVDLNTWAMLLKDTPTTAAFSVVSERCLECCQPIDHVSACSSHGDKKALTVMQSRLSTPPSSDWKRVFVKPVGERFYKVEDRCPLTLLAHEPRLKRPLAAMRLKTAVEAVEVRQEVRHRALGDRDMTDVCIQASVAGFGGTAGARKGAPLPAREGKRASISELANTSLEGDDTTGTFESRPPPTVAQIRLRVDSITPADSVVLGPKINLEAAADSEASSVDRIRFLHSYDDNQRKRNSSEGERDEGERDGVHDFSTPLKKLWKYDDASGSEGSRQGAR